MSWVNVSSMFSTIFLKDIINESRFIISYHKDKDIRIEYDGNDAPLTNFHISQPFKAEEKSSSALPT